MEDLIRAIIQVLIVVIIGAVPLWLATRRSRKKFKERFGREATEQELDSLGAWLKDPKPEAAAPPAPKPVPTQPQPRSSFGNDPRA